VALLSKTTRPIIEDPRSGAGGLHQRPVRQVEKDGQWRRHPAGI